MTNFDPYNVDIEKCKVVLDVQEFGDQVAVQVVHVDARFKKEKPQSTHPKPVDSFNSIVNGEVFALMSDELPRWIEALRAWSVSWEGFEDKKPYIVPLPDDREPQVGDVYGKGKLLVGKNKDDKYSFDCCFSDGVVDNVKIFTAGFFPTYLYNVKNKSILEYLDSLTGINGRWQNGEVHYDPLPELGYMEQTQANGVKRIFIG